MIAPLRRSHRRLTLFLAVAAPTLLLMGVSVRPTWPTWPPEWHWWVKPAAAPARATADAVRFVEATIGDATLSVFVHHEPARVELEFASDPVIPEALVYIADLGPEFAFSGDGSLPEGAQLLGPLAGADDRSFATTVEALERAGACLVFYSLGHHEVVAYVHLGAQASTETGG